MEIGGPEQILSLQPSFSPETELHLEFLTLALILPLQPQSSVNPFLIHSWLHSQRLHVTFSVCNPPKLRANPSLFLRRIEVIAPAAGFMNWEGYIWWLIGCYGFISYPGCWGRPDFIVGGEIQTENAREMEGSCWKWTKHSYIYVGQFYKSLKIEGPICKVRIELAESSTLHTLSSGSVH